MNPFDIFDIEEREKIAKVVGTMEDRIYTKEEWIRTENKILDEIMSQSYKSGKLDEVRNDYSNILNKIENYKEK